MTKKKEKKMRPRELIGGFKRSRACIIHTKMELDDIAESAASKFGYNEDDDVRALYFD